MADYNVNMKQWNGTSFDNVLPLAYNAKQLEGQSLAEVKQWVQDNGLLLYTGQYTGTGTYGQSNKNTLTFNFEPKLVLITTLSTSYSNGLLLWEHGMERGNNGYNGKYVTLEWGENSVSWYFTTTSSVSSPEALQLNSNGLTYYFAAIGGYDMGGQTEWTITQSGTWIVPRTGRYYIELYGGGGMNQQSTSYLGGSSCQSYDSITLTKGMSVNVSIGYGATATDGTGTTFGNYSVVAGGNGTRVSGGAGAGNLGTTGGSTSNPNVDINASKGSLGSKYGYGIAYRSNGTYAGNGAVYLKYLGA